MLELNDLQKEARFMRKSSSGHVLFEHGAEDAAFLEEFEGLALPKSRLYDPNGHAAHEHGLAYEKGPINREISRVTWSDSTDLSTISGQSEMSLR